MVFQAGQRDSCTWDVARLSESVKIHSPAARVFLRFPKVLRHPSCMDHAILHGKPFDLPLFGKVMRLLVIFIISINWFGVKLKFN
jgi:hypothetical protein